MSSSKIFFQNPLWLFFLILVLGLALTLIPFFMIKRKYRYTRNRVVSLVIRCCVLVLGALLVGGIMMHVEEVDQKTDVIFVVDVTESCAPVRERMNQFLEDAIRESDGEYNIGVVTFGYDQVNAVPLTRNTTNIYARYLAADLPDTAASDIGAALQFAANQLPAGKESLGRLVLLSDAVQTDGNITAAIAGVVAKGVRVDTVYFRQSADVSVQDAQIVDLKIEPKAVSLETPVLISAAIRSTGIERPATLKFYDGIEEIHSRTIVLNGLFYSQPFSYQFKVGGFHPVRAELVFEDPRADAVVQNNQYFAYVNIQGSGKILILEGGAKGEGAALRNVLLEEPANEVVDIKHITDADAPKTLLELQGYEQIILMNVSNAQLEAVNVTDASKKSFPELLDYYVKSAGGGLFTTGGQNAYRQDDMKGSVYEGMLPVDADPSLQPLALLLMLDISTTMGWDVNGTIGDYWGQLPPNSRLDYERQAALAVLDELDDGDFVGVIFVGNNDYTRQALPMTPMTRKSEIIAAINGITVQGTVPATPGKSNTGTLYNLGFDMARDTMLGVTNTDRRHVIFFTDGSSTDNPRTYPGRVQNMYANNITTSVISFCADQSGINVAEELARDGGGNVYILEQNQMNMLSQIAKDETSLQKPEWDQSPLNPEIAGQYIPFIPIAEDSNHFILTGLTARDLPAVTGFYGTKPKEDQNQDGSKKVKTVLRSPEGYPIYADWQYGLGRVGSLMLDLSGGDRTGDWLTDVNSKKLLTNIIKDLIATKPPSAQGAEVKFTPSNYTTMISITEPEAFGPGVSFRVTAISPTGNIQELEMNHETRMAAGYFTTSEPGVYELRITRRDANGNEVKSAEFFGFAYSAEFDMQADRSGGLEYMRRIADDTAGMLLVTPVGMFDLEMQSISYDKNPKLTLLIIFCVLLLLDIASRKFKFKWPHEWPAAIREKKAEKAVKNSQKGGAA